MKAFLDRVATTTVVATRSCPSSGGACAKLLVGPAKVVDHDVDAGRDQRVDHRWQLTGGPVDLDLPPTLPQFAEQDAPGRGREVRGGQPDLVQPDAYERPRPEAAAVPPRRSWARPRRSRENDRGTSAGRRRDSCCPCPGSSAGSAPPASCHSRRASAGSLPASRRSLLGRGAGPAWADRG